MTLVTVARFEDPAEGSIAAAALRAEGVEALFNENGMGSADPFMRRATGGFPLWVLDADVAEALRILEPLVNHGAGEAALPRADDDSEEAFKARQDKRRRYRMWVLGLTVLIPSIIGLLAELFAR